MECVQTVSYNIFINGEPTEPFNAAKGLRQGDPMSPFLFAIGMEYLKETHPQHLLSATASKLFSQASGLVANLCKSSVYFGGVTREEQDKILQILGFSYGELPFKYLGVPLATKKISLIQWQPLLDRITSRISSWTAKNLSYAGRAQLIKSAVFGIQAYWTQLFSIPAKVLHLIDAHCKSYLWAGSGEESFGSLGVCL
ncbi:uncharacterized protein LOC125831456 [Solanum verrucosum]|uniref:uncharacterized protein LOC125831456 n=1 Tax=Solanum verrucosum TaxID=315347 RepID=UPI0020D1E688|nr:uncharacterized protein LOC125831456 [Solanum verrucosum]